MLAPIDVPPPVIALGERLRQASAALRREMKAQGLVRIESVEAETETRTVIGDDLGFVLEGVLSLKVLSRVVRFYADDDLILGAALPDGAEVSADFGSELWIVQREAFEALRERDARINGLWRTCRDLDTAIAWALAGCHATPRVELPTEMVRFEPGDMIVSAGAAASEVFILLDGEAEVRRGGVHLGDVRRNEIFGEVAVLCSEPRSADVVATRHCLVQRVPAEHFSALLTSRPSLAHDLAQTLARRLRAGNERIVLAV